VVLDIIAIQTIGNQANHIIVDAGNKSLVAVGEIAVAMDNNEVGPPKRNRPFFDPIRVGRGKRLDIDVSFFIFFYSPISSIW
jgi:hypothetical protein